MQHLAYRWRTVSSNLRPIEAIPNLLFQRHDYDAWSQLRHTEIRSVQYPPSGHVAHLEQTRPQTFPVILEDRLHEPTNILDHHGSWLRLLDQSKCGRE